MAVEPDVPFTASPLPPPGSGSFLEVSFRRLLSSCEDIVAGDNKGRADLSAWQRSPVFHHYVETLQEQLADLSSSSKTRVDKGLLDQYRQHVDAIANQLEQPELPAYCLPPPAGAAAAAGRAAAAAAGPGRSVTPKPIVTVTPLAPHRPAAPTAGGPAAAEEASAAAAAAPSQRQQQQEPTRGLSAGEQRSELGLHRSGSSSAGGRAAGGRAAGGSGGGEPEPGGGRGGPSVATQARLQTQANLQDGLTDELVGLAASLKSNTIAMEGKLRQRGELLENAEGLLDTSVARTKASAAKATAIHKRSRLNFCLQLLIMMAIGGIFAGMYIFIRVTRMAGYKAVQRAAPLPSPAPLPPPVGPAANDAADAAGGGGMSSGDATDDGALLTYERHYEF